ncbi:hypothetical protein CTAYLR_001751 [Chrysophaeum taylorii]|uniref:Cadherin domain-containing protein n=1 Tax=Chrysophaeum taylorii TaxID=2483200 RepID=A0AAD7UES3_9STRA|nr:hypothetical protein CTAYLR_001751 [Chrysophaeum taylorii]
MLVAAAVAILGNVARALTYIDAESCEYATTSLDTELVMEASTFEQLYELSPGVKNVILYIDVRYDGDITIWDANTGDPIIMYAFPTDINWYPVSETIDYLGTTFRKCLDTCTDVTNVGPYYDGSSFTIEGEPYARAEYVIIQGEVTTPLIVGAFVLSNRASLTYSLTYDCKDSCTTCYEHGTSQATIAPTLSVEPTSVPTLSPPTPAGTYRVSGASVVCPAGRYSTIEDAKECDPCPTGRFLGDDGTMASLHDEMSDCSICGSGSYAATNGTATCDACPAGRFSEDDGVDRRAHDELADCGICWFGTYSEEGAATCTSCPPGTFLNDAGTVADAHDASDDCTVCAAGEYSTAPGAAFCAVCPAGRALADAGTSATAHDETEDCEICAAGEYASSAGLASCALCPAGTYNDGASTEAAHDSADDCVVCSAGTYAGSAGSTTCDDCPEGRYLDDDGVSAAAHASLSSCMVCAQGTFTHIAGTANCISCPAGSALSDDATNETAHDSADDCSTCEAGEYAAAVGSGACSLCPAGRFLSDVGTSTSLHDELADCNICSAGTYAATVGSSICADCPAGTYLSDAATSATWHDSPSWCLACPSGSYSAAGSANCASCGAGTFASGTSNTACLICAAGSYADASGAATCISCPSGRSLSDDAVNVSRHDDFSDCKDCAVDTFCAAPGGCASCDACPADEFAEAGSLACYSCGEAGSGCAACAAGTYLSSGGECHSCPECTYSDAIGATECSSCETGKYNSMTGQSSCVPASPGYYASDTSLDTDGTGVSEGGCFAVACPAGRYTNAETGYVACEEVAGGAFASDSSTDDDGVGVSTAAVAEASCPAGKSSTAGQYKCTDCPSGRYSATGKESPCHLCPAGVYGEGADTTDACTGACDAGYVGSPGAKTSLCSGPCAAGYYCPPGTGAGGAIECGGADVYCPEGSSAPIAVLAGEFTTPVNGTRRDSSSVCVVGTYCPGDGAAYACPGGTYGASIRLASASCSGSCEAGYWCPAGSTTSRSRLCGEELATPASVYCPAGSSRPTNVSEGRVSTPYWDSIYARTNAVDCSDQDYCSGSGARVDLAAFDECPSSVTIAENSRVAGVAALSAASALSPPTNVLAYSLYRLDFTTRLWVAFDFETSNANVVRTNAASHNGDYSLLLGSLTVPSASLLSSTAGLTLAFWIRPEGFSGTSAGSYSFAALGAVAGGVGSLVCQLELEATLLTFDCGTDAAPTVEQPPLYDGLWTHLAVSIDAERDEVRLWINGVAHAATSVGLVAWIQPTSVTFGGGAAAYVDDVALYGTVLAKSELDAVMSEVPSSSSFSGECAAVVSIHNSSGNVSTEVGRGCTSFYATFAAKTGATSNYAAGEAYCTIRYVVTDVNDAPYFDSATYSRRVSEAATINTQVGAPLAVNVTEPDAMQSSMFSLDDGCGDNDLGKFGIVACTGQLVTLSEDLATRPSYDLCVTVTDGSLNASASVTVFVLDVNDPPELVPVGPSAMTETSPMRTTCAVAENLPAGTTNAIVGCHFNATDPDDDDDGGALAWLLTDPYGILEVDAAGALSALVAFDYEAQSTYYGVQLSVSDGQYTSDPVYITLRVTDANDAPYIEERAAQFAVPENSDPGTVVGSIADYASDQDGDELAYSLISWEPSNVGIFAMSNASSGIFTIESVVDYENFTAGYWSVLVAASDGEFSTTSSVSVALEDVNEAPYFVGGAAATTVKENASIGTVVATLLATDPDDDVLTWSLDDDDDAFFFEVDVGVVSVRRELDFETKSRYVVRATVEDPGGLAASSNFSVLVLDVNEAPVMKTSRATPATAILLEENKPIGTLLAYNLTGDTIEPDDGQSHAYALFETDETTLDSGFVAMSGRIATRVVFDYETDDAVTFLRVRATDDGRPAMTSNFVTLCVALVDVNEAPSVEDVHVSVLDDTVVGSTIAVFAGTDPDAGDVLTYAVLNQTSLFAVSDDDDDEELVLARSLSGMAGSITIYYQAYDRGGLASNVGVVSVNVSVGVDDAPTIFLPENFTVSENAAVSTYVGTVRATNAQNYYVVGGTGRSAFEIDVDAGVLSTSGAVALDYEALPEYTLRVSVTGVAATTFFATFFVKLVDEPEAPTLPASHVVLTVAENATIGQPLHYVIKGADQDAADVERLVYAITFFSVVVVTPPLAISRLNNTNWGRVAVATSLDYETTTSYSGDVKVYDTAGLWTSMSITVVVEDVNEPPAFAAAFFDLGSFPENSGFAEITAFVPAVDPENDGLAYTIVGGDSEGLFRFEGTKLYVMSLDYEYSTNHTLRVVATETTTRERYSTATTTLLISVIDVNDLAFTSVSPQTGLSTRGGQTLVFQGSNIGSYNNNNNKVFPATATYGAFYRALSCTVTTPGLEIACVTDEGVGQGHTWNLTVGGTWALTPFTTSYAAPVVSNVTSGDGMHAYSDTAGGDLLTISGANFGPVCSEYCDNGPACGGCNASARTTTTTTTTTCEVAPFADNACDSRLRGSTVVTFGTTVYDAGTFTCGEVRVVSTTALTCVMGQGFGSNLFFRVIAGDQTSPATATEVSFRPPVVNQVVGSAASLSSRGGEILIIRGTNFGPPGDDALTVTYGPYTFVDCAVAIAHVAIECTTVEGVGTGLAIVVTRSGVSSAAAAANQQQANCSYAPPEIAPLYGASTALSGVGSLGVSTRGGDAFYLTGSNFGPDGTRALVTYDRYAATSCVVTIPHEKLSCRTVEGTGAGHALVVTVGNQSSAAYSGNLSYTAPFIAYYEPEWGNPGYRADALGALTAGGENVILHGSHFGPLGTPIDLVYYGAAAAAADKSGGRRREYVACDETTACGCAVIVAHVEILCETVPATGVGHAWTVVIDGQSSTAPTTNTQPPGVSTIVGSTANNISIAGGDLLAVIGENFGSFQDKLQAVTYGPRSGIEYAASNCTVIGDSKIECRAAAGIGVDMKWLVTVDAQTSELSKPLSSYQRPSLRGLYPATGDTSGGSTHVLNGSNLGLGFDRSKLEVLFDGATVATASSSSSSSSTWYNCGADREVLECVAFTLPELGDDTTQEKEVTIKLTSIDYAYISLEAEALVFAYNPPEIYSVTNVDGEYYGTDLVLVGRNFGKIGEVWIDGTLNSTSLGTLQATTTYDHERITLTYDWSFGTVYVKVGDEVTAGVEFKSKSPQVVTNVAAYAPDPAGYSTSGSNGHNLTIVGYHFAESIEDTEVYVGPWRAVVLQAGAVVDDSGDDVLRSITFLIPPGSGSNNPITVYAAGRPSYAGSELSIAYLPPAIRAWSPAQIQTAGASLVIRGENFGPSIDDVAVTWSGVSLQVLAHNHSFVEVKAAPGEGVGTLELRISDQATRVVVSYAPPRINAIGPPLLPAGGGGSAAAALSTEGGVLRINGSNFGLSPFVSSSPLAVVESVIGAGHAWIDVRVGPGQGINKIFVNVSGLWTEASYAFGSPTFSSIDPTEASTNGGVELTIKGTNFGVGSLYSLEFCCGYSSSSSEEEGLFVFDALEVTSFSHSSITVLSPAGQSSAPLFVTLKTCADSDDAATCTTSVNDLAFNFSKPRIHFLADVSRVPREGYVKRDHNLYLGPLFDACYECTAAENTTCCVFAACDRQTAAGCGLRTAGGAEVAIVGENFGTETPNVWFDGVSVDVVPHDEDSHSIVFFVVPRGAGAQIPVEVRVQEYRATMPFSYDPPYVSYVTPNTPDAEGTAMHISGHNFGETEGASGDVRVFVGGRECRPVIVGETSVSIWQQTDGVPYLYCTTPRLTVGAKELYIHAASQNVTYDRLAATCADGYYGQEANTAYITDFGLCYDDDDETERGKGCDDDGEDCVVVTEPWRGTLTNCTAITTRDEYCLPCPRGSTCAKHNSFYPVEPISEPGFYRLDKLLISGDDDVVVCDPERSHRARFCYDFIPCSPDDACLGNNTCAKGYAKIKCARCCDASETNNPECVDGDGKKLLYHRSHGICVECPTNYAMVACLLTAAVLVAGAVTYVLKRRRVDVAVVAIGIDYLQVLSLFATADVEWPGVLQSLYASFAVFSFDVLDVFPPECSVSVAYTTRWLSIQFAPVCVAACAGAVLWAYSFYVRRVYERRHRAMRGHLRRFRGRILSSLLYAFYFIYLFICKNTLDVLNCDVVASDDGETKTEDEYLASAPDLVCWKKGSKQMNLVPLAAIFILIYVIGYPLFVMLLMSSPRSHQLIVDDQLLRMQRRGGYEPGLTSHLEQVALCRAQLGMLYYRFKPRVPWWAVLVVLRKMCMAIIMLLFRSSPTFQLAMLLLVLFTALVIQMRALPYVSPRDYDTVLGDYADRVTTLHDEEKQCEGAKEKSRARRRRKQRRLGLEDFTTPAGRKEISKQAVHFFFDYNTVEGTLLSASILVCVLGVMLDSDYLDNGKHAYAKQALIQATIIIIALSFAYLVAVVWHEIIVAIFPNLTCSFLGVFADAKENVDGEEDLDEGLEFAEKNQTARCPPEEELDATDQNIMTVQEQLAAKRLIAKLQEENHKLKREAHPRDASVLHHGLHQSEHKAKKKATDTAEPTIDHSFGTDGDDTPVSYTNPLAILRDQHKDPESV